MFSLLREEGFSGVKLESIATLFVGGDSRYGLGKIFRLEWRRLEGDSIIFGKTVDLGGNEPEVLSNIVWGHALVEGDVEMRGVKELLGGWNRNSAWKGDLAWVPGSFVGDEDRESGDALTWVIGGDGCWRIKN